MKMRPITYVLIAILGISFGACLKQERPQGHHHHPHWNPKTKAEKHCYKEGFKPGTEEFQICIKKYEENIHWKKEQQENQREEKLMRQKERQERLMEKKARQEKLIEKKARQEEQMQQKARQEKRMEEKARQNKTMKEKKTQEKESK